MAIIAGCNGSIMLDAVEEPLDAVAQLVDTPTEGRRIGAMIERADVGVGTLLGNFGAQLVAVVAAIRQQNTIRLERAEHVSTRRSVVGLPLGQLERDRETITVDDRVDFGRKPAAGASHATTAAAFFSPLAAC